METATHVLVVDDDHLALDATARLLEKGGYRVSVADNGDDAIAFVRATSVDAVLTDINMPRVSGIELLEKIHGTNPEIPVVLMTAYAELEMAVEAIKKGTFDFLIKPYRPLQLYHSMEKAVNFRRLVRMEKNYRNELEETVKIRTDELKDASREMILRLVTAAEFRDDDTGAHIKRMSLYAKVLAESLGLRKELVEHLSLASTMHDVGKIGIPDSILLKPGRLSPEEFAIMKNHTLIGEKILCGSTHATIRLAASIALNHHERWDGTGYPGPVKDIHDKNFVFGPGKKGSTIPLSGRIVILADVYDALVSKRAYKDAWEEDRVLFYIKDNSGKMFDPELVSLFFDIYDVIKAIREKWA